MSSEGAVLHISVTGISHQTTPVELRERFAFASDDLAPALMRLPDGLGGAALLSTCNRTELYLASESPVGAGAAIVALASAKGEPAPEGIDFFHRQGSEAVRHLFRVAAGVESLVIGESEILGQVREGFSAATAAGSGSPVLARLFHSALRVGRRARSETEIGAHGLSVAALAVSLSKRLLGDLRRKTVLVVGAGEAGQRSAGALVQSGVGRLLVTTRRSGLAQEIATELGGVAVPFEDLPRVLAEADVMITATAAASAIVSATDVAAAMASRPERPLLIVDIAVPRDVDSGARDVPGVHLFDIDDLQAAAEANLEARRREVGAVEVIVDDEVARFETWLGGRRVIPTIAALRQQAERLREAEVERTLARLSHLDATDQRRIEAMSKALIKRLLHSPVNRLRDVGSERHVDALRDLFELDDSQSR
ncbi:MAG TPA: glutamyl-tRNA reductase [Dehalococcoidia bacterium]|nr:glutamyl-tRNA reductase [Dehalococcoidia bacterium]